jgi:hypothetical protein
MIRGYEPHCLLDLLDSGYEEEEIETDPDKIPTISYKFEGTYHTYYPDIFIKSEETLIEVKSYFTWNREYNKNLQKMKSAAARYSVQLRVYNNKGKAIYFQDEWPEYQSPFQVDHTGDLISENETSIRSIE